MRGRRILVTSAVLLGLLATTMPARAAQMDARERPFVRGPLRPEIKRCRSRDVRFERRVVAVVRSCIRLYRMRAAAETDESRNYGAIWLRRPSIRDGTGVSP